MIRMPKRAFHQRFRIGFAVFFQQMLLKAAGIHADANGTAMIARRLDHFLHAFLRSDIAGIDAQARRAGLRRFNGAPVVEMDIGHDRHIHFAHNLGQRRR